MTSCYFRPNKKGAEVLAEGKRLTHRAPDYGTWWIRYQDAAGRPARERTKARLKAEAERLAHEKAQRASRVAAGLEKPAPVPMTCEELFARYLDAHQHLSGLDPIRSQLKVWLGPHFKRTPVSVVTPADCDALLRKSRGAGQAQGTVRQLHIRGRSVFQYAVRLGARHDNPWTDVPRPDLERKEPRFLSRAQVLALLEGAARFRLLFLTAVLTGLRRGELAGLRWEDVHWDEGPHGILHVARSWGRKTTKSGRSRLVPLHPALKPEMEAAFRGASRDANDQPLESYVFPSPHGGMRRSWQTVKLLRTAARRARITLPEGFTFHDLRKTFLTHLIQDTGGNVGAGQRLAGHSSPTITAQYYMGEDVRFLVAAVGSLKLVSPAPDEHKAGTRKLAAVSQSSGES